MAHRRPRRCKWYDTLAAICLIVATVLTIGLVLGLRSSSSAQALSSSSSTGSAGASVCSITALQDNTTNSLSLVYGADGNWHSLNDTECLAAALTSSVACIAWFQEQSNIPNCQTAPYDCCWLSPFLDDCGADSVVNNTEFTGPTYTANVTCVG